MNNALDADWFGALGAEQTTGQFTVELLQGWQAVETPVQFPVCGAEPWHGCSMCRAAAWR
ncbi:hypothetical protein [Faecalibacterium taiwanense]|uniref:hypothetical protein n=1 Tax=Faecalibacterium taiwanense TaxID=3030638 RepID=UPI003218E652